MTKLSNEARFANVSIDVCLERAEYLYNQRKEAEMSNEEIYKFMGLSINGGYATKLVASMKYYGIIDKSNSKFFISKITKEYIKNKNLEFEDFKCLISKVPIYNLILKKYTFDEIIKNKIDIRKDLIEKYKYTETHVKDFFKIQEKNINFAFKNTTVNNSEEIKNHMTSKNTTINNKIEKNDHSNYCNIELPIGYGKKIEFIYPEELTDEQIDTVINFSIEYIKRIMKSKYTNKKTI